MKVKRLLDWVKDTLLRYADLPVVPVRYVGDDKVPLKGWDWGRWKDGGQSEEERRRALELFERGECDGLAVVCGVKVEGRGYFFTIDVDLPFDEAVGKIEPTTRFEKTLRGRLHAYYFSQRPVPTKTVGALELKGYGSLTVIFPSHGYEKMNDNLGCEVEDGFALFRKIAAAFGYDLDEHLANESGGDVVDFSALSGWLNDVIIELERRGLKPRRGPNYFSCLCPFHPEKQPSFAINHRRFYAVDYHDGKVYNMKELAKSLGLEVEKVSEKEKRRTKFTVGELLPDGRLIEVVEGPLLLVYKDGEIEVYESLEVDGVVYRPPPHIPFPLPGAPAGIGDDGSLWAETKAFISEHFFHLDDDVYDVLTAAVAWSYFYRDVKASTPYILFLGPWRSGKSRGLEVMEALAYRAIRVVDPSEASLFRCVENFKPTLFIDESQIIDPAVRAVLASGYRYGSKVMRVVDPEAEGFDGIKFFNTYAFVIYASREEPPADIFSRTLTIHCEKNLAPVRKTIDSERAVELRTRWLAQRLRFHDKIKVGFDEFESDDSRLQEIVSPLKAMALFFGGPEAAEAVERYGRKVEKEIRAMESVGPEAEVLSVVVEILGEGPLTNDSPVVSVAEITRRLNDGGSPAWKPEGVGKILSRLGFEKVRLGGRGLRGYRLDLDRLKRYALRYNIPTDRWQVHFDRTCQTCQSPEISAI
jgi:hypothetical protein